MINILKTGLVLLIGVGFGFGVDKLANKDVDENQREDYYQHMHEGFYEEDFIEHMRDDLTDEEMILVEAKIDELLVTYDITLEELNENSEIRYDFMNDLMDYLYENEIDFHSNAGHHNHHGNRGYGWHGSMWMH